MMYDLTGKQIDRYQVDKLIASGGMSYVYRAFDTKLKRNVAIKMLKADAFPESDFPKICNRFMQEAQTLSQMAHPNIVSIYDYDKFDEIPYLVMELLEGTTLRTLMGTPIPYQSAAAMLIPIADALSYMHSKGLVHRDIKPSNIAIKSNGIPVLTDFGIASPIEKDENVSDLTKTGYIVGTPNYMSPEQALGQEIDGRSDEYALGIIFYELLTGQKLFKGDTALSVIAQHLNSPVPDIGTIVPGLPEQVNKVLKKSLAKKPEERYPSMKEFTAELQKLVGSSDPSGKHTDQSMATMTTLEPVAPPVHESPTAAAKPKRTWLWAALSLPVLAGGVFGIKHFSTNPPGTTENPTPITSTSPVVNEISILEDTNTDAGTGAEIPISVLTESVSISDQSIVEEITSVETGKASIVPTAADIASGTESKALLSAFTAIPTAADMHITENPTPKAEETPEEKYGLRFAVYTVSNAGSDSFRIRKSATQDAEPIDSAYAEIHNGDILESTGKSDLLSGSEWIGVRTKDGFEGWIPAEMAEKTGKGIEISIFDDFDYSQSADGIVLKKYKGSMNRVIIPAMIEGQQVTAIGVQAFYGSVTNEVNKNIRAVVIPEGVVTIDVSAFNFCESLEYVSFPKSLKSIKSFAFGSDNLLTLDLPESLNEIGSEAFSWNKNLKSVAIPDGVTKLNDSVFYQCESLSSVTLPQNLVSIGINTFMKTALTSIEFPESLRTIGWNAFESCKLTDVSFPENLASIDKNAFVDNQLTEVTVSKYTKIEAGAFDEGVKINLVD